MLTREDTRTIERIAERAIRERMVTKHHRYSLSSTLRIMKERDPDIDLEAILDSTDPAMELARLGLLY